MTTRHINPRTFPRAFLGGQGGIAAVEFALVLPILVTLWLGMAALIQLTNAAARTTMAAQSVADLVAQGISGASDFQNIVKAAGIITASTDANNPTVNVASLTFNAQGTAQTAWQCTVGGNSPTQQQLANAVSNAAGLASSSKTVIMVTVVYTYTPTIVSGILGTETFVETAYETPRLGQAVAKPC